MSDEYEYLEDDDVGDPEAREQIAELRAQLEEQEELRAIQEQIVELERNHGSRFTHDEVQQIGALIDSGVDPRDAYDAVEPEGDDDREYAINVERLEREEGRTLSEGELASVWQSVEDGADEIELYDLDTTHGRREWAAERLGETFEQPEAAEAVEPLHPDAGPEDRRAYMAARMDGAEVDDPYAAYE